MEDILAALHQDVQELGVGFRVRRRQRGVSMYILSNTAFTS